MKITDLQVDGFGVWKGLVVEGLSDEITVFCGYNEAGKTTLMQFIRSMMFGFSPEPPSKCQGEGALSDRIAVTSASFSKRIVIAPVSSTGFLRTLLDSIAKTSVISPRK